MRFSFPLFALLIVFLAVAMFFVLRRGSAASVKASANPKPLNKLDKAGIVTNWVLGILHLPLSFFFFLMGTMAGEPFMYDQTPAQSVLITLLSILAIFPVFVSEGGILASVILRSRGHSGWSFGIQFAGLVYFAVMLVLLICLLGI